MHRPLEAAAQGLRLDHALQRLGLQQRMLAREVGHAIGEVAAQPGQRLVEQRVGGEVQKGRGIAAALHHDGVVLADHQQQTVRLHGTDQVDRFEFAVRQVDGTRRRHDVHGGPQLKLDRGGVPTSSSMPCDSS